MDVLPVELLLHVCSLLSPWDLRRLQCVSKHIRAVINTSKPLKELIFQQPPDPEADAMYLQRLPPLFHPALRLIYYEAHTSLDQVLFMSRNPDFSGKGKSRNSKPTITYEKLVDSSVAKEFATSPAVTQVAFNITCCPCFPRSMEENVTNLGGDLYTTPRDEHYSNSKAYFKGPVCETGVAVLDTVQQLLAMLKPTSKDRKRRLPTISALSKGDVLVHWDTRWGDWMMNLHFENKQRPPKLSFRPDKRSDAIQDTYDAYQDKMGRAD